MWSSIHDGSFLTRIRRRVFGLTDNEQAENGLIAATMMRDARARSAEEDRLFDEWYPTAPKVKATVFDTSVSTEGRICDMVVDYNDFSRYCADHWSISVPYLAP